MRTEHPELILDAPGIEHHEIVDDEPQIVSAVAPRLDMDIPLLSPLARSQSFNFSSPGSHNTNEPSPRLFHYAEDEEDVVDNNSGQYYPLMDYSETGYFPYHQLGEEAEGHGHEPS